MREYNIFIMLILDLIEAQPEFPVEDLTEHNEAYLSLIIANRDLLSRGHMLAKEEYPVLARAHQPLLEASKSMFDNEDTLRAINFGITAFEAITFFVGGDEPDADPDNLEKNTAALTTARHASRVERYFHKAHAELVHDMPRTTRVVAESSARYHGSSINAAVFGAAITRRFELDNR